MIGRTRIVVVLVAGLLLVPTPAHAHGIDGDAAQLSIPEFVPLGIEHVLLGWDHLAFVGVVGIFGRPRRYHGARHPEEAVARAHSAARAAAT